MILKRSQYDFRWIRDYYEKVDKSVLSPVRSGWYGFIENNFIRMIYFAFALITSIFVLNRTSRFPWESDKWGQYMLVMTVMSLYMISDTISDGIKTESMKIYQSYLTVEKIEEGFAELLKVYIMADSLQDLLEESLKRDDTDIEQVSKIYKAFGIDVSHKISDDTVLEFNRLDEQVNAFIKNVNDFN